MSYNRGVNHAVIAGLFGAVTSCGTPTSERSPNPTSGGITETQTLADFQLTCKESSNTTTVNALYDCSLVNSNGRIFTETSTQKIAINIMSGDRNLPFEKSTGVTTKNFSFFVKPNEINITFLKILIVDPTVNNKTLLERSNYLENLISLGGTSTTGTSTTGTSTTGTSTTGTSTTGTSTTGTSTTGTSTTGTSTTGVSFVSDVQPIMINKCASCHTEYASYSGAKNNFDKIKRRVEAGTMPPSGKLPQATIQILTGWSSGQFKP